MPQTALENTVEYKAIQGQINIDDAQGIIECFVAGIGNKDSVGDICMPGCFTGSLKRRKPRVVWGHNWNEPIGKVLEIYEVPPTDNRLPAKMRAAGIGGLYARVQFNLKSERGRQAFADVSFFGEEQEWSIGYKTLNADYDSQRQANMLREVELYEVSPVLHGANQLTATISIKSDSLDSPEDEIDLWMSGFLAGAEEKGEPLRDPKGGLTAAGRAHFRRTEGSNLKPGVQGPANTPQKMRRKGSFLTRFFTNPSGPMKGDDGKPTRLALSAAAWGEPVPQNAEDAAELAAKGRRLLERYSKLKEKGYNEEQEVDDDDDYTGPRGEDGGIPAANPAKGRMANLAKALAMRFGGAVRLREADLNQVIFDHMSEDGEKHTYRVSYHFDGDEYMFGNLVKVKPQMVFLPDTEEGEDDNEKPRSTVGNIQENPYEDQYDMDENPNIPQGVKPKACGCGCMKGEPEMSEVIESSVKAPVPPDAIPQERFTGDVMRGYGPRRGNLERLLRYWRPIMRREGGFRRCRVILANHPELYPLNNICAWLHHETTGLWPNEGCHHPGMKNCRRKLRGVVNGSIWNDDEWNDRLSRIAGRGKSDDMESMPADMDPQKWEESAVMELKTFIDQEPELVQMLNEEKNWMHEGEDEGGQWVMHMPMMRRQGSGCGCGGACGGSPRETIAEAISSIMKSVDDSMETKAGRVISTRNMSKLTQALTLLQEVVESSSKPEMQVKASGEIRIVADLDELFDVKTALDPVINFHEIDARVKEDGIYFAKGISSEAKSALLTVLSSYKN